MEICDDVDGDLEYTISALSDKDGPLNAETGDAYQDVYYIDELKMETSYNDASLKSRIIEELPTLIFTLFHVTPDLLAFYPAPLEYTPDPSKRAKYQALQGIAAQKIDSAIDAITTKGAKKQEDEKTLNFAAVYQFSEDELNLIMRRRYSGSSYPKEAKDMKEYDFYEANGFQEAGDSRLLYKHIEQ